MEKVIYDNGISKAVAVYDGELIEITQYFEGNIAGVVNLYNDEIDELFGFLIEVKNK